MLFTQVSPTAAHSDMNSERSARGYRATSTLSLFEISNTTYKNLALPSSIRCRTATYIHTSSVRLGRDISRAVVGTDAQMLSWMETRGSTMFATRLYVRSSKQVLPGLFRSWLICFMTCFFYGLLPPSGAGCTKLPWGQSVACASRQTAHTIWRVFFCFFFLPRAENIKKYCHEHSLLWRRDGAKDGVKTEKSWSHKAHQSI